MSTTVKTTPYGTGSGLLVEPVAGGSLADVDRKELLDLLAEASAPLHLPVASVGSIGQDADSVPDIPEPASLVSVLAGLGLAFLLHRRSRALVPPAVR